MHTFIQIHTDKDINLQTEKQTDVDSIMLSSFTVATKQKDNVRKDLRFYNESGVVRIRC